MISTTLMILWWISGTQTIFFTITFMKFGSIYYWSSENMSKSAASKIYIQYSNIWWNISQTFSPQLGASDIHLQAFACPLAECLTTPLETISEVQLNVFASWHRHVSSVQSTFSDGVQVRTLGRPFQNIHSSLIYCDGIWMASMHKIHVCFLLKV